MEGKAVLFKKFAGIDVFDLEVAANDPERLIEVVAALEPTFGGINLEDIKAPECFEVEARLRERMKIPVFHDDQHGTAIIVAAAVENALHLNGKKIGEIKLVTSGAGAAALACLNLLVSLGLKRENVWVTDIEGVVYEGRTALMDRWKGVYAQKTDKRKLGDVIDGADIFLGLSAPGVLKPDMAKRMAKNPLIMALANPTPEITPEDALAARPDAMICTGRSDYPEPGQQRAVLSLHLPRRARCRRHRDQRGDETRRGGGDRRTGARSAVRRGGARDWRRGAQFRRRLAHSQSIRSATDPAHRAGGGARRHGVRRRDAADREFRPVSGAARRLRVPLRLHHEAGVHPGEDRARARRLRRRRGRAHSARRAGGGRGGAGAPDPDRPAGGDRGAAGAVSACRSARAANSIWSIRPTIRAIAAIFSDYVELAGRKGITPDAARTLVRTNATVIAALTVARGDADAMICGVEGRFLSHLRHIRDVIGYAPGVSEFSALSLIITPQGRVLSRRHRSAARSDARPRSPKWRRWPPCMCAASGLSRRSRWCRIRTSAVTTPTSARKMRAASALLAAGHPELEIDGEMHGDTALDPLLRERVFPHSRLHGQANVLIMPNLDAANIAFQLIKTIADALPVGPILIGAAKPAHILSPSVTARGVVNMTAVAVVEAQERAGR